VSLGLIALFRAAPVIGLGVFSGVVADAVDRRRLMLVTQSVMAVSSALLAVLTLTRSATPAAIYGLTFLTGLGQAFDSPARQSVLPALVPRSALSNAFSLNATTLKLASVAGPALGGLLIARAGLAVAYGVDAVSFLAVIGAVLAMRHRHVPPANSRVSVADALEGLRFVRSQPLLIWLMVLDFAATFFAGANQLMPIFADQIFGVGERGLGLLLAAAPAGAVVAAAVMSARHEVVHRGPAVLGSVALYGLAIAGFGVSRVFWLALVLLAVAGGADMVSTIIRQTVRNVVTPDAFRGRMTSLNMIFFIGGPQLGEVEAGLVAQGIGAVGSVVSGGLACFAVAIAVAAAVPAIRRHRAT